MHSWNRIQLLRRISTSQPHIRNTWKSWEEEKTQVFGSFLSLWNFTHTQQQNHREECGWIIYFSSAGRSVFLSALSIGHSFPQVVEGNSGHEQGDGEVTSVPFPKHDEQGEETVAGSVKSKPMTQIQQMIQFYRRGYDYNTVVPTVISLSG